MKKLLMILTSHRLDCLKLNLKLLDYHDDLIKFEKVVFLMSGVSPRHKAFIERFIREHPDTSFDKVEGPRGRKIVIADMQNECIRRHPEYLYFKTDEDVFTSQNWVDKMEEAYLAHANDDDLGLMTPIAPNNGIGCFFLLENFTEVRQAYDRQFEFPVVPDYEAPIWNRPKLAQFMTESFLDLEEANKKLEEKFGTEFSKEHAHYFSHRFTINCICYDYRHYRQMGRIPDDDEPSWTQWAHDNGKHHVLVPNTLVHHYSFFPQQDSMDRSHVLENLAALNLPSAPSSMIDPRYEIPRIFRTLRQLPRVVPRKLNHLLGRPSS